MTTPFPTRINLISDGETVNASTTNRPLEQLTQRTVSLNERVTNALLGTALFDWEQPVQADLAVGMAVYRDNDGIYRPGLAATEVINSVLSTAASSFVVGVVQYKHSSTQADIVFTGKLRLTSSQLQAITVDGAVHTGQLFLSASPAHAGKLSATSPGIGIPVAVVSGPDADDEYSMIVFPAWKDFFADHIHYHVRIDNNLDGGSVDGSSDDMWEAAGVDAPDGAVYRYRHEDDLNLVNLWPPIPIGAVHYDLDGIATDLVTNDFILIDQTGIFWMNVSEEPSAYRHDFYFLRMTFKNNDATVTALKALDSSIVLKNLITGVALATDESGTGPLGIRASLGGTTETDVAGSQALKEVVVDADGNVFRFGPVLAGIRSTDEDLLTATGTAHPDDPTYVYGLVDLTPAAPATSRSNPIEFVSLDNVPLSSISNVHFYEFQQSPLGHIVGRLRIPEIGLSGTYNLTLNFLVLARAAGTMPNLPITYRLISKVLTPTSLPTADTALGNLPLTAVGAVTLNQYVSVNAPVIPGVQAGDLVIFTLARETVGSLPGSIGIISHFWSITPTA